MKKTTIDIKEVTIKNFVESIRPKDEEMRKKIDMGYSYDGSVILLFEIRPDFMNPAETMQSEIAKIRFYKSRQEYNLYWIRASGKWELYEPFPESPYLDKIIEVIRKDEHGCFFG